MNIFRSLMGRVWHDPNAAEVVKISTGQLYLVRPGNVRSERECIYNDAMATIRRVPAVEHNFQLVVTRVYEDGDQELLDDEEETDEERVFLISEELEFRTGETPEGDPRLIWRDLQGDVDEFYEFVAAGTNGPTRAFFETCMYRAMYERKYRTSADSTQDSDLEEFVWKPSTTPKPSGRKKRVISHGEEEDLTAAMNSMGVSPQREPSDAPSTHAAAEPVPDDDPSLETLLAEPATLLFWDRSVMGYGEEGIVTAKIVALKDEPFHYFLIASSAETGQMLAHKISSSLIPRWHAPMWALSWNHVSDAGDQNSWCLHFQSQDGFDRFQEEFTKKVWETLNGTPWEKIKPDERRYVLSANVEDVEMKEAENDSDDEEAVKDELEEEGSESDDDRPIREEGMLPADFVHGKNKLLNVGYKGDRSYVTRGNNIGVFGHSNEGLKFVGSITKLKDMKGKNFDPKHMMLHEQDSKLVLQNPDAPNSLFELDLERGKIVEEWRVHDNVAVSHIAPDNKFAQTTHEQTLVGASHNALFRIDPRVSGNKMVDSQYKQYTGKNKFSGVTTTASGKLAVASEKGDIRLFDSIGKNAKTALPPLGDPIIGIDATSDGRYIVATTQTYLLLIDTLIGTGRYKGQLGFDRSFPADAKPQPKRLQIRPEHVAYMNHNISLSPARFNTGEDTEENAIVTSTGQFVIAWDFKKVKKGQLDKYEIKKYEDLVVQDNFRFGDDNEIIVALENNVLSLSKKQLKRPTRTSLAPETDRRRSRGGSGIVREYR
ncbi:unnamed protein product [Peniophora sp. CBMAI 1063]|nr:unnamed protein product [Peniophora sp. CBMAI 1063]